jgi:ATP-dependent RNA/DNA helicase IGHMBP2
MPRGPEHFTELSQLLDLEQRAERERLETDRTRLSLAEREARGLTMLDLELLEDSVGLGGRYLATFERPDRSELPFRLYPGDLVELSPRRAEPAQPTRAVISRATPRSVQLAFDRDPPPWVGEGRILIDIIPNDVTFDRARAALRTIAAMDRGVERQRREVLLGSTPPRFERPPAFEPTRALNPEQREAVALALSAQDFCLVHGPPGTGKSTVLAEVAVQEAKRGSRILATAASNTAVDRLLELSLNAGLRAVRVGHPARVAESLQEHTLDLLVEELPDRKVARELFDEAFSLLGYARKQRTRGRSRERFQNARESTTEARKLLDEARKLERKAVKTILDRAQVICATCASLPAGPLAHESFDVALLDEATQALEPIALIAFTKAPRVVLAGDHKQLSSTVLSEVAAKRGLGKSLFERLLEEHGEGVKRMLREQYRMHEQIMAFPSAEMYGGELRAHASAAGRTLAELLPKATLDAPPFLFLDTAGKGFEEEVEPDGESRFNAGEAELVTERARELLAAGLPANELAVIAPYRAQVSVLRERIPREVEVDTVDAFQGREKDVVLVSLTRSNPDGALGFLEDLRRMNVAITRARRHLFVVGDSATLGGHPFYARLVERAQAIDGYRSAWSWPAG